MNVPTLDEILLGMKTNGNVILDPNFQRNYSSKFTNDQNHTYSLSYGAKNNSSINRINLPTLQLEKVQSPDQYLKYQLPLKTNHSPPKFQQIKIKSQSPLYNEKLTQHSPPLLRQNQPVIQSTYITENSPYLTNNVDNNPPIELTLKLNRMTQTNNESIKQNQQCQTESTNKRSQVQQTFIQTYHHSSQTDKVSVEIGSFAIEDESPSRFSRIKQLTDGTSPISKSQNQSKLIKHDLKNNEIMKFIEYKDSHIYQNLQHLTKFEEVFDFLQFLCGQAQTTTADLSNKLIEQDQEVCTRMKIMLSLWQDIISKVMSVLGDLESMRATQTEQMVEPQLNKMLDTGASFGAVKPKHNHQLTPSQQFRQDESPFLRDDGTLSYAVTPDHHFGLEKTFSEAFDAQFNLNDLKLSEDFSLNNFDEDSENNEIRRANSIFYQDKIQLIHKNSRVLGSLTKKDSMFSSNVQRTYEKNNHEILPNITDEEDEDEKVYKSQSGSASSKSSDYM